MRAEDNTDISGLDFRSLFLHITMGRPSWRSF